MNILIDKKNAERDSIRKSLESKSISITIEFENEEIIGLTEVKRLMTLYKNMLLIVKKGERELITGFMNIRLFNRIRNFDLTFIAALNLFKFSFKNILIQLAFDRVSINPEVNDCFFRLGHFLTTGFLSYGQKIFNIVEDGIAKEPYFFLENLSGYLPFIYVDKEIFQNLFHVPFKETWDKWWNYVEIGIFKNLIAKKNEAEKIYQELRDVTIYKIKDVAGKPGQDLLNFFIIYLFNAVRKFHFIKKVLKNQSQDERFKKSGIIINEFDSKLGIHLSKEGDQKYERETQYIFNKILDKPPAFVMLFSYFIEKFYNPVPPKKSGYDEKIKVRIELISNIFYFTNEIFFGIRELAKNIIEHSSNKRGVVIGRVLNKKDLSALKKIMYVNEYLIDREENEFIELIVMDDGEKGITDTTITNLNLLKKEFDDLPEIVRKFENDIFNLSRGKISLPDFFNPNDIKLNYQEIRSALSLGLLIFSHLVLNNNGYMTVSSQNQGKSNGLVLFSEWEKRKELEEIIPIGTFYNILFPKSLKQPPSPRSEVVPFEMPSGESAFNKLFKLIRCSKNKRDVKPLTSGINDIEDRLCIIDFQVGPEIIKSIGEIIKFLKACEDCSHYKTSKIISIDLKNVIRFDPTDLFRFLARIQMAKDAKSIIVHNAREEVVEGILKIFEIFNKTGLKIASNDHFVLFYYLKKEKAGDYFYLFLLAGETWDDLSWINERIAKTNYTDNILKKYWSRKNTYKPSLQFFKEYFLNALFTSEGHLLPFDVLIERSGLTLFEHNVLSDLNKSAEGNSFRSYKFKNAHMRLGSKIHLRDFFYARRIFQNSFYSLRFAYIVSKYIDSNFYEWTKKNDKSTKRLTIIGYGMYSELLISNVARFLKNLYPEWDFDHAIVDVDEHKAFRVLGNIIQNVILIIPISSTLSTSLKIVLKLNSKFPDLKFMSNPINILIVGSGSLKDLTGDRDKGRVINPTVAKFWKYLDAKEKIVTSNFMENQEKFFLYLSSEWFLPQNCNLCFPENPVKEVVLFETDKISVTPSMIFELPPAKESTLLSIGFHFGELSTYNRDEQRPTKAVLTENMLEYGHISREKNHYIYYIETTEFLERNKELLMDWLSKVKHNLHEKNKIFESRVFLIAPAHITNADFINLVNEIIFNDVATLLHYDQDEDYIQNLRSFFGEEITTDSYVFYIDDAVSSGRTFGRINDFIKYARHGDGSRGVDGAFVLINRLTQDKQSILLDEFPMHDIQRTGFFSFIDLDVPIMIDSDRFCHLCSERTKYLRMLPETILDSLRILIKAKIIKLDAIEYKKYKKAEERFEKEEYNSIQWTYISKNHCIFANQENKNNYLKRLEFAHKLYRGFYNEAIKGRIKEIFNYINSHSLESLCKEVKFSYSEFRLTEDEKVNLIKVLSNPYFVYHKDIKKYIFQIIIIELDKTIQSLLKIPSGRYLEIADMNMYRYLKFLIKRASMLKANYLIRDEVILKIISLNDCLRQRLKEEMKKEGDIFLPDRDKKKFMTNLDGFIDFYIMAIKEVIWFNESKSLKLEETLNNKQFNYNFANKTLSILSNSLRIENISIPLWFLKSISKEIGDIPLLFTKKGYESDIEKLSEFAISYCKEDPYRSEPLLLFLGLKKILDYNKNGSKNIKSFLKTNNIFMTKIIPMILLKAYFLKEKKKEDKETADLKYTEMDFILYCLCKILDIKTESGGSFLVVKYMKAARPLGISNLFIISHIGKNKEIDSFDWKRSFTSRVFSGWVPSFKKLPLTHVQIFKQGKDIYTHYGERVETEYLEEIEQLGDMKNFLFLRLADNDLDSTARGVIVFYNQHAVKITPENLRYALILKNDIFEFIEKNYENYSFKLYQEKIHQIEELEALNSVIARITAAAGFDEVYRAVQATKVNIQDIDEMCLLILKNGIYQPISKCLDQNNRNCERCKLQKIAVIQRGSYQPYYSPCMNIDPFLKEVTRKGLNTSLIIPLVYDNDLLGIFEIASRNQNAFSHFERKILTSLASQVAISINQIKYDKQSEIFKNISHSLGTYLTTMRVVCQRIIEGNVTDDTKKLEYFKIFYGDVFALINAVDEISSLANMEYWDTPEISEIVDIVEVVERLAERNQFLLDEKYLKLNSSTTCNKVYVKAYKQKLEEALQFLLHNAIKFSDENKNIEILVLADSDHVSIRMKDQGYGIDNEDLKIIFEKYKRGRIAREKKTTGTGIGLAAAKSIIEKHSGTISVESELGIGSTFTVELPIFKDHHIQNIKKEVKK